MRFLTAEETRAEEKRIWRQLGDPAGRPRSARAFVYQDTNPDYRGASQAIVAAVTPFTRATLLVSGMPFGDGWDKLDAERPAWRKFYALRDARGEHERLYHVPGHVFDETDGEDLITLIAFALELGWDALLAVRPGRNVLWLSHDDRIEFHVGFKHRTLTAKLVKLGFYSTAKS